MLTHPRGEKHTGQHRPRETLSALRNTRFAYAVRRPQTQIEAWKKPSKGRPSL